MEFRIIGLNFLGARLSWGLPLLVVLTLSAPLPAAARAVE